MYMIRRLDDGGMAYVYTMSVLFLIVAGVILALMAFVTNPIITEMNNQIEGGHVSAQTQDFFGLGLLLFQGIAGITLLGTIAYIIHEAYKRGQSQ